VPAGTACNCTPYPQLSAADLSTPSGHQTTARNEAVPGYTSADVVGQLSHDAALIDRVRQSAVVEVEVGANDVAYSTECGSTVECYTRSVPEVEQNLRTIVQRVHQLTTGHPALVVLLDYWSVWLGGQYAHAHGEAYADAAAAVTSAVDTAIKTVAAQSGSGYVDLRAAFKGPDYTEDETDYLASDGDHPNAAGHRQIAAALNGVIRTALHLPPP
jgi:lysophospholipase L1-like esterase